jgi:hypothetical protein
VTIYVLLGVLVLISALVAGNSIAGQQSLFHVIGLAATLSITIYMILDMEYPHLGLIRVDAFQHALVHLRDTMQ